MVTHPEREVIVVGGGITGLSTAWRLREAGVDVALIEANDGVGGCMRSEHRDGFILEKGPFNVLVRDPSFRAMLETCSNEVEPRVAADDAQRRYLLRHGALYEVPTGPGPLVRSPLLSARAKLRMLTGMLLSRRARTDEPTIAEAATRRLGPEVAETFISSIVAGVFGGDSRALSLKACFPKAWRFDQEQRSPLLYEIGVLRERKREAARAEGPPPIKGLVSFDGGLQSLPDWLASRLGEGLVTGCRVERVERNAPNDAGYTLTARIGDDEHRFTCRQLVLAAPKQVAARLLTPLAPDASAVLDGIESSSLIVLNLGYRREDVAHPMVGYGFLVPQNEPNMPVMGVLWADSAFPHHASDDRRLIRVFMGGTRDPEAMERSDEELVEIATKALSDLLGLQASPSLVDVCRWPEAIPQYHVGHGRRIEQLQQTLGHLPDLHLAGNYLQGVSINDCIRDGIALGDKLVAARGASSSNARRGGSPPQSPRRAASTPAVMPASS
jgi:oxygen-dependent protoporphyrinogen oxidase